MRIATGSTCRDKVLLFTSKIGHENVCKNAWSVWRAMSQPSYCVRVAWEVFEKTRINRSSLHRVKRLTENDLYQREREHSQNVSGGRSFANLPSDGSNNGLFEIVNRKHHVARVEKASCLFDVGSPPSHRRAAETSSWCLRAVTCAVQQRSFFHKPSNHVRWNLGASLRHTEQARNSWLEEIAIDGV